MVCNQSISSSPTSLDSFLGDNSREDFYSRYSRNSQVAKQQQKHKNKASSTKILLPSSQPPSTSDPDEDVKWRCRHCTFDNHSALENCEICEYRRDTHP